MINENNNERWASVKLLMLALVVAAIAVIGIGLVAVSDDADAFDPTWGPDEVGEGLYATYVVSTHTLTITGAGEMYGWNYGGAPWYDYHESIENVNIVGEVTTIGNSAFYSCTNITSVNLSSSIAYINDYAFFGCMSLQSISLLDSLEGIGIAAFDSSGLQTISFSNNVRYISTDAFANTKITSVSIPSSVDIIGANAFASDNSPKLTTVHVETNEETTIGTNAFGDDASLKIFVLFDDLKSYKSSWSEYADKIFGKVEKPMVCPEAYYNGEEQTMVYEKEGAYTVSGGSATIPGNYTATIKLADNVYWTDGTDRSDVIEDWTMYPNLFTPSGTGKKTYSAENVFEISYATGCGSDVLTLHITTYSSDASSYVYTSDDDLEKGEYKITQITGDAAGYYDFQGADYFTVVIEPKAISISNGETAITKTYDGTTDGIELTLGTHYKFKDVVGEDSVHFVSSACSFNSKDVSSANKVTIASLILDNSNYSVASGDLTATITAKAITISNGETAITKPYDGKTDGITLVKGTHYVFNDVVGEDSVDFVSNACAFNSKDVASADKVTISNLELNDSNYTISSAELKATITARSFVVPQIWSTFDTGREFTVQLSGEDGGLIEGDSTNVYVETSSPTADSYNYTTAKEPGDREFIITGLSNTNYSVSSASLFTIQKASIKDATFDLVVSEEKYDGKEHTVAVTNVKIGGVDLDEYYYEVSCPDDMTNAGEKTIVLKGANSYEGTTDVSQTYEITKRKITLTSESVFIAYQGTAITNETVHDTWDECPEMLGFVNGEGAEYNVTGTITNVGEVTNTFTYTLDKNTKESNYEITKVEGTLKVGPAVISGVSVKEEAVFTYTGTAIVPTFDDLVITVYSAAEIKSTEVMISAEDNINAGTATVKVIPQSDNFSGNVSCEFTINKLQLTVTDTGNKTKVYDSTRDYETFTVDNKVKDDVLTVTAAFNSPDVIDANKISFSVSGTAAGNYISPVTWDSGVSITAKAITISNGETAITKPYNGTTDGITLVKGTHYVFNDVIGEDVVDFTDSANAFNSKDASSANKVTIASLVLDNTNYSVASGDLTASITAKNITLTSASDTKVYDGTPLTNGTVTDDGFVEGEGATYSVTGSQTVVGTSKNVFSYTLNEGTSADNYEITIVEGDLTVTKAAPVITVKNTSSCPSGSYDVGASTTSGETMTYVISTGSDVASVSSDGKITAKAVGTATLKITSPANDNYAEGEKTFTITVYDHIHVIVPGTAPTKTATGLTEGEECSECHKIFTEQKSIPATGSENTVIESNNNKVEYIVPKSDDIKTLTVKLSDSKYTVELNEESTSKVKDSVIDFSIVPVTGIDDRYTTEIKSNSTEFTGVMKITLPYDPSKGTPSVRWVEGNEKMDTVSINESDKTITFSSTHNSTYAVEYSTGNDTVNGIIIGIVMIAAVVLLGLGVCLVYTRKQ